MPGIITPPVIVEPFGLNAAPGDITLPIPVASPGVPGQASYDLGFPHETMLPIVAGGTPPFGQDVNGILYTVTASIAAAQAGQPWLYNATIVAAIGGYPVGTILGSADGAGLWINTVAANVTNPDGGAASGWAAVYSYGATVVAGLTNANVTLTPAQWKKSRIAFTGALTGNIRIIFPVNDSQEWLLCNLTTGAFSLTAATAAGVGVVIPQGGMASPTGVYCDPGTGIQPTVSPLAVPIDQAPTPLTLVERTNAGYILATYLNQNSASNENPAIGSVFVENTGADGFLRKATLASFLAQALPPIDQAANPLTIAERNSAGYLYAAYFNQSSPLENITPDALFFESGNDGFLRKISPANLIANLSLATQSYANGTSGSNANGFWYKLPNGIIEQYGRIPTGGGGGLQAHTFPIPFPVSCDSISGTACAVQATLVISDPAASRTGFTFVNGAGGSITCWRATGH